MRITSLIAAIFISASFLYSSVDNAAMAVAFAKVEPARFLTYRAINKRQLYGMKRRALYKRQRAKDDDEDRSKGGNEDRNGKENEDRNGDENENGGTDRGGNSRNDRDDDRQNNNGKEDGAKAKNDEDDERNAKDNNRDSNEEETSADSAEADENSNDGESADNTAADDTAANTTGNETSVSGEGDSNLYNNGPSPVNTKGVQNGTVIAVVTVGGLVLIGASIIVFMRKRKHGVQQEAIIEKSATAFAQQNSEYETLQDDPPPIGTFNVISNFAPNLSDELEVEPGDQITVLVEYDDGWVQGINESRGGTKGVMPRHCLNMNSKYSMNKRSSSIAFTNVNLG